MTLSMDDASSPHFTGPRKGHISLLSLLDCSKRDDGIQIKQSYLLFFAQFCCCITHRCTLQLARSRWSVSARLVLVSSSNSMFSHKIFARQRRVRRKLSLYWSCATARQVIRNSLCTSVSMESNSAKSGGSSSENVSISLSGLNRISVKGILVSKHHDSVRAERSTAAWSFKVSK